MWQASGHVFSSELNAVLNSPIGRLYRHDTSICWEAPYSAFSGYGAWVETTTGPLGVSCSAVSSAAWYTKASSMSGGATYTGAETISSGYMGIRHMVHETTNAIVVGGEMDGRTLSDWLTKGKPVEGEIYVVATSSSQETLVASTEASAQAQLRSASNVDPGSVGGLTGSSAQMLQSQLGAFASLWLHSETVTMADSHGLVSQRCPSSAATAYVAIGCTTAREDGISLHVDRIGKWDQAISLQRLATTSSELQLLLVWRHSHWSNC